VLDRPGLTIWTRFSFFFSFFYLFLISLWSGDLSSLLLFLFFLILSHFVSCCLSHFSHFVSFCLVCFCESHFFLILSQFCIKWEKWEKKQLRGPKIQFFCIFCEKNQWLGLDYSGLVNQNRPKKMQNKMHFLQTWFTKTE
jgi:hypothetical protein